MEPPRRNPSFDITEPHAYTTKSPSPAPTYRYTSHFDKNYPSMDEKSGQALEEKHTPFYHPQAGSFDTSPPPTHAHFPANLPNRPTTNGRDRFSKLSIIIPWTLFTIFFLITLWYTSIAFGIRLFVTLHPSSTAINTYPEAPVVNIIMKGETDLALPSVLLSISTANPPSKTQAPVLGNSVGVNLGTSSITSQVEERKAKMTGFVVVTRRG
jgi:hypothetical protein